MCLFSRWGTVLVTDYQFEEECFSDVVSLRSSAQRILSVSLPSAHASSTSSSSFTGNRKSKIVSSYSLIHLHLCPSVLCEPHFTSVYHGNSWSCIQHHILSKICYKSKRQSIRTDFITGFITCKLRPWSEYFQISWTFPWSNFSLLWQTVFSKLQWPMLTF